MGYTNFSNNGHPALNDEGLMAMQKGLMELVFPIGSTYITESAEINPNTILGFGIWERFKGKIAIGIDEGDEDFNTVGNTGGEKEHTLVVNEIPSHRHEIAVRNNSETGLYETKATNATGDVGSANTLSTGGGQPHNNLQPYEVVGYMWIRRS